MPAIKRKLLHERWGLFQCTVIPCSLSFSVGLPVNSCRSVSLLTNCKSKQQISWAHSQRDLWPQGLPADLYPKASKECDFDPFLPFSPNLPIPHTLLLSLLLLSLHFFGRPTDIWAPERTKQCCWGDTELWTQGRHTHLTFPMGKL